jgi:hypothetical protein
VSDPATGAFGPQAAITAELTPEVRILLQGGDEAVGGQGGDAGTDPGEAAGLAHALPDHPRATDLGQGGEAEQQDGAHTDMVAPAVRCAPPISPV